MHVVQVIDSLVPAGAERSLAATAPLLVDAGIQLDVVTLSPEPGLADVLRRAGCRVDAVRATSRPAIIVELRRELRARRPDLVHTVLFEADVLGRTAALLAGVPVVSSLVNEAYGPRQRATVPRGKLAAAFAADVATARFARRFHAVSSSVADVMTARLRLRPDLVEVIPRGRDEGSLGRRTDARRADVRERLGVTGERVVLAVARHEHQKGLDVLVRAMARLHAERFDARLLIAGRDGSATPALRELVERHGLRESVDVLGPRDDVADLLCGADAFVLASRWEGMPGALVEAMALEAPIVATDIAPAREVLGTDPPALLVAVDDDAALAQAIQSVLLHAAPDRVEAARARFEAAFRIEQIAAQMAAFYRRAADGVTTGRRKPRRGVGPTGRR